ncbi:MAG: hypothetical protein PHI35_06150 [Victivallaceae bacterium]|nr:hypothetical protein [Victivallaceae bacterium]
MKWGLWLCAMAFFACGIAAANDDLAAENEHLKREILELREKLNAESDKSKRLRLWLAGAVDDEKLNATAQGENLLRDLALTRRRGDMLAIRAAEFVDEMRRTISGLPLSQVRRAELGMKLDDLAEAARSFAALKLSAGDGDGPGESGEPLERCRVLAVDLESRLAALSVGASDGAFRGLVYRAGADGKVVLRIINVRSQVSAAEVISGSIDMLSPGMAAVLNTKRH